MKNDEFDTNFAKYEEKYSIKSNSSYWREINLSDGDSCSVDSFENIYYKYFPKTIK